MHYKKGMKFEKRKEQVNAYMGKLIQRETENTNKTEAGDKPLIRNKSPTKIYKMTRYIEHVDAIKMMQAGTAFLRSNVIGNRK